MSKEKRLFEKGYKFPLKESFSEYKVFTQDFSMAFDFPFELLFNDCVKLTTTERKAIIAKLNGGDVSISFPNLRYSPDDTTIFQGDKEFIVVRGWGHLTGTGGLYLKPEEAAAIQDDFANYILEKLNSIDADERSVARDAKSGNQKPENK